MVYKLNNLIKNWPAGAIRAVKALVKESYSPTLLAKYRSSDWLKSAGDGAVYRSGDTVEIYGGVYALQNDYGFDVHIGGITALELIKARLNGGTEPTEVDLFGTVEQLPQWFLSFPWAKGFHYRKLTIFHETYNEGFVNYFTQGFDIKISIPMRAVAEYLAFVPNIYPIENAVIVVEELKRPHIDDLQKLLENCKSIKVKRLLLAIAEGLGHPWVKNLDLSKINLGTGKRHIEGGEEFDPKYQISIPKITPLDEQEDY